MNSGRRSQQRTTHTHTHTRKPSVCLLSHSHGNRTAAQSTALDRENPLYESQELTIEMFQDEPDDLLSVASSRADVTKVRPPRLSSTPGKLTPLWLHFPYIYMTTAHFNPSLTLLLINPLIPQQGRMIRCMMTTTHWQTYLKTPRHHSYNLTHTHLRTALGDCMYTYTPT